MLETLCFQRFRAFFCFSAERSKTVHIPQKRGYAGDMGTIRGYFHPWKTAPTSAARSSGRWPM